MIEINGEKIWVVHFSGTTADHCTSYPKDLLRVREYPDEFCLCCSAFTTSMVKNDNFKPVGDVGLLLDVSLEPTTQGICCKKGEPQIRYVSSSDIGRPSDAAPCCRIDWEQNICDIKASLNVIENTHNEWIIKPPHRVKGIYIHNNPPSVMHKDGNNVSERWRKIDVKKIRQDFKDLEVWCRNASGEIKLLQKIQYPLHAISYNLLVFQKH